MKKQNKKPFYQIPIEIQFEYFVKSMHENIWIQITYKDFYPLDYIGF